MFSGGHPQNTPTLVVWHEHELVHEARTCLTLVTTWRTFDEPACSIRTAVSNGT